MKRIRTNNVTEMFKLGIVRASNFVQKELSSRLQHYKIFTYHGRFSENIQFSTAYDDKIIGLLHFCKRVRLFLLELFSKENISKHSTE